MYWLKRRVALRGVSLPCATWAISIALYAWVDSVIVCAFCVVAYVLVIQQSRGAVNLFFMLPNNGRI